MQYGFPKACWHKNIETSKLTWKSHESHSMHLTDESFESIEHFIWHNKAADGNSGLIMEYLLPQEIKES